MSMEQRMLHLLEQHVAQLSQALQEQNYGRVFLVSHDLWKLAKKFYRMRETIRLEENYLEDEREEREAKGNI